MPPETTEAVTDATSGAGATPTQTSQGGTAAGATPAAAAAPAAEPATGEEALGDTGKDVLRNARRAAKEAEDRAKAAEEQLAQLQESQQTDSEKAITTARREAAAEERTRWQGRIREAEVRGALRGAGIVNDKFLDLAIAAPVFRDLKVDNETGTVDGVTAAIEVFKKDYPEAFSQKVAPGPGGSWGGSEGGSSKAEPETLQDAVMDRLAKQR